MTMQEEAIAWVKRSWKPLAAGAVVVSAIIGVSLWYAVSGVGRKEEQNSGSESGVLSPTSTEPISNLVHRALDGVMVEPEFAQLQPYSVMIDNNQAARPQSGLSSASLVYEIPVEGGMTRLMAVYDASSTVEQVGPVRSARLYYEEFAQGLGAVYAHVGGSPEALNTAKTWKDFKDLNEFANSTYFWRSKSRFAPHNVYTSMDLLRNAFAKKKWSASTDLVGWKYLNDTTSTSTGSKLNIPVIRYAAELPAQWSFDPALAGYTRVDGKVTRKDADGSTVLSQNVVVIETDGQAIDDYGRMRIRTTGKGRAVLYRDGKSFEGIWKRLANEHLRFETVDGADLLFRPGQTWVQVILPGMMSGSSTTSV